MTSVSVDRSRCSGHARCFATSPEFFALDDEGFVAITEVEVGPEQEDAARRGALACPEHAITVRD